MLSDSALEESPYRTLIGGSGSSFLYRNNYSLPLGFVMDEQAIANWTSSTADRMASLNSLTSALGAEGQMLYPATCVTDANAGDTTIDIAEDGYYYADYVSCTSDTLTVNRSDGWTKQYSKTSHRYLIELGECKAGDEIHIGIGAAAGCADLFLCAGAVGGGAVAGHLFEIGLHKLFQDVGVCTLAVVVFKVQHGDAPYSIISVIIRFEG